MLNLIHISALYYYKFLPSFISLIIKHSDIQNILMKEINFCDSIISMIIL